MDGLAWVFVDLAFADPLIVAPCLPDLYQFGIFAFLPTCAARLIPDKFGCGIFVFLPPELFVLLETFFQLRSFVFLPFSDAGLK